LAGELKLNVYIIDLTQRGLTDGKLLQLFNLTPPRCILLLEEIDTIIKSIQETDKPETSKRENRLEVKTKTTGANIRKTQNSAGSAITLGGLLSAIDGVAAQIGRLLFLTTNHKDCLDPALIRPGRIDYSMEFNYACKEQISGLYINFFGNDEEDEKFKKYIHSLADRLASRMPENAFSMSEIQGLLMMYRTNPSEVINIVEDKDETHIAALIKQSEISSIQATKLNATIELYGYSNGDHCPLDDVDSRYSPGERPVKVKDGHLDYSKEGSADTRHQTPVLI